MTVSQALQKRHSARAFLDKEVPLETIKAILESAKQAPSGVNMQPWKLAIVSGKKKKEIQSEIEAKFEKGEKEEMEYPYYPLSWEEPYKSRRKETGLMMYKTLGITREDKERQIAQWKANYRAFDAPYVIYFFIDKSLEKGSYIDYGMFLQSLMLSAVEHGLGTCPQAAHAEYPKTIKKALDISNDKILLGGIALGYEDENALINSYRTNRVDIEEFSTFYK